MSLDATRWVWLQQGLRPLEKLVLLALADRVDAGNRAFPSYEVLKQDTGADRKTIWRALKALQMLGLIRDSGERKGKTSSIVVWELVGVELREQTRKQFQKRNIEPTCIEPTKEPLRRIHAQGGRL